MLNPSQIIAWLRAQAKDMRHSRVKTLSSVVAAATRKQGLGVLALGRAMPGATAAKHRIKRVWRFLRNERVELTMVHHALLRCAIPPRGPVVVLIDWTDLPPFRSLILAIARRGRAVPFLTITVSITGPGGMLRAEAQAVQSMRRAIPAGREIIIVGDRGFGSTRWIRRLGSLGWGYVLRLGSTVNICTDQAGGTPQLRRGDPARSWGTATLSDYRPTPTTLVSIWRADSKEPWLLASNLSMVARKVVKLYAMRMWIELSIRDIKNRRWGLGIAEVRLSQAARMDRLFLIALLAYFFLTAYGVAAERRGLADSLKANTTPNRVLNLATTGFLLLNRIKLSLSQATKLIPLEITP